MIIVIIFLSALFLSLATDHTQKGKFIIGVAFFIISIFSLVFIANGGIKKKVKTYKLDDFYVPGGENEGYYYAEVYSPSKMNLDSNFEVYFYECTGGYIIPNSFEFKDPDSLKIEINEENPRIQVYEEEKWSNNLRKILLFGFKDVSDRYTYQILVPKDKIYYQ